jgi:hypothetical protein
MESNFPFDYITDLHRERESRAYLSFDEWQDTRKPPRPYIPVIRPTHLRARRYWPTHPLLKISKKLPQKLPNLEKLPPEELARRFMLVTSKFKWSRRSVWT